MRARQAFCVLVFGVGLGVQLLTPAARTQNPAPAAAPPRFPDVLYIPTPPEVVDAMLEVAQVKSSDVVYDLGSGDGRIPIAAAKKYGARGVGIEIDPELVRQANENARAAGVSDKVRFVTQDLFETDLREATVVTLYLLIQLNEKLRPKIQSELKPGSRVVSHAFPIGDWKPEKVLEVSARQIFFWTIK